MLFRSGLAFAVNDLVAAIIKTAEGPDAVVASVAAHPAIVHVRAKSPMWNMIRAPALGAGGNRNASAALIASHAFTRQTATFRYVGPAYPDADMARLMWSTGKVRA